MRLLIILFFSCYSVVFAANSAGFVKNLKGEATATRENKIINLKIGDKIFSKDILHTQKHTSMGIIFEDNTLISLGANTEFIIEDYVFKPAKNEQSFIANITKGTMSCLTGLLSKLNPDGFKIKAKSSTIGIRGTHFIVSVE